MKKHKKARMLTMDDLPSRPCTVDDRPALLHRWMEEDRALLQIEYHVPADVREAISRRFRSDGIVPPGCSVKVIRNTLALVEYRDGTIDKVDPERIRFTREEGQTE